ncbi:MAG: rRNA maturation RNase YbeY [Rhodothermales bacterium]
MTLADSGGVHIEVAHPSRTLNTDHLRLLIHIVADGEGMPIIDVSLVLTDHATVLELNQSYLQHDYHTDVLSFSLTEAPEDGLDGEVYVDLDTAAERCVEFGTSYEAEALRYAIHGVLHLMGYDDATDAERVTMRRLEDQYLGQLATLLGDTQ